MVCNNDCLKVLFICTVKTLQYQSENHNNEIIPYEQALVESREKKLPINKKKPPKGQRIRTVQTSLIVTMSDTVLP